MTRSAAEERRHAWRQWRARNPDATCGWGGSRDDPAPCRAPVAPYHYLCERHWLLIPRQRRSQAAAAGHGPRPVVTRRDESIIRPRLCAWKGCGVELEGRAKYCDMHRVAARQASSKRNSERRRAQRAERAA
jgi:hypothetical protein